MAKNPIQIFNEYQGELGETYVFHFGGIKKAILSSNPTVLQHVLKTNYENFPKSEIQMKRMCHFLGRGLLTTHGKLWLSQRRLMQQAFHRSHLTQLIAEMQDVIDESLDKLDENYQGKPADIYTEMMKITFRMVMRSLFSTSFSEEDLTTISNSILEVQEFIIKQVMLPFMNPWYFVSGELEKYEKISRKSYDILLKHVQKRRVEKIDRVDFLQILLDCIYEDTGVGMNDEEVLNESMQMMVAGHETSSNALSWTLYLLCLNPEHIEKIRTEVETLFGNNKIAFSELHKLEYTSQVLDESMRLFPPFWMLDREVAETDKVADIDLPKGTMVLANIYGVHHDPKYWDNPEEFRPSRFTKENQKKQQPFTYIPFGGGPRMCIGINYAIAQMQLILVSIIRRYDLELVSGKKTVLKPLIMLKPEEGIKIRFHKR
jgi:cytochrome P450